MESSLRRTRDRLRALGARAWAGPGLPVLFVAVYALAYPIQFPFLKWQAIPHTSFASITGYRPLAALGQVLAGLALVALCWRMWRLAQVLPQRTVILLAAAGWAGAAACALLTFAGQSTDMGDYIFRAHMFVHLDRNPLITAPSALIPWKEFPYLSWYKEPDYYGPLWYWLSGGLHALAGEGLLANFLALKGLAAAAIAASGGLIYALLKRLAPGYAAAGLVLWLWNPLVLNEGVIHGHNDLILAPFLLGALWLAYRGRGAAGLLVVVAAGLIKASAWVLLPVLAFWIIRRHGWRRGAGQVILAGLAGAALVWLAYRPFGGWEMVLTMAQRRGWWPANSWTAALFFALRDGAKWPHALAVRWIIGGATALFVTLAAALMLRLRDLRVTAWAVTLAYLLVGCHWFQPWYTVWPIAFAALIPDRRIAGYTFVLTFFMVLHPVWLQYVVSRVALPPGGFHVLMAAATLLVPQALAAWLAIRQKIGDP